MTKLLDNRQLRTFVTIAKLQSFTLAARELFLTQSALSHQIHALEEQVTVALFQRKGKSVRLTEPGHVLFRHAELILAQITEAQQNMAQKFGDGLGQLRIGALPSVAEFLLPSVLHAFQEKFPRCELTVHPDYSPPIAAGLLAGDLDVGLAHLPESDTALRTHKLFESESVMFTAPRHPWARKRRVPIEDLPKQLLIIHHRRSTQFQRVQEYCASHNLAMPNIMEAGSYNLIKDLVRREAGVGLAPQWVFQKEVAQKQLAAISFPHGLGRQQWGLLWKQTPVYPAKQDFVKLCQTLIPSLVG